MDSSFFTVRVLCCNCDTEFDMHFTRGTRLRDGYPGPQHLQDITRGEWWSEVVDVPCGLCGVANLRKVRRAVEERTEVTIGAQNDEAVLKLAAIEMFEKAKRTDAE